jgi:hypothetical protein
MTKSDTRRKASALALLSRIESWRLEFGRPVGETRNPLSEVSYRGLRRVRVPISIKSKKRIVLELWLRGDLFSNPASHLEDIMQEYKDRALSTSRTKNP